MKLWVRAVFTVALLAAVPIVLLFLFGGLVAIEVFSAKHSMGRAMRWLIVTVPAGLILGRGLLATVRKVGTSASGVPLTEREQPELWELVHRLAVVAGTRPPDEIYLTGGANASVMEETRFLGLVATRRRMFVGVPLIAGLREDELAAILTHELAHYSNRDTRLTGVIYRGRRAFVSTISALHEDILQKLMRLLLEGFLRLYLLASTGLARRQERAADEAAARAVGSSAAANSLRELAAIVASWELFMSNHLVWGWDAGYLPADVFAGYAELRASITDSLDQIRRNPPEISTRYDTHPPMNARVAAIEAMAAEPVIDVGRRQGLSLLRNATAVLDAALFSNLVPQARDLARVEWSTLANIRGRAVATATAETTLSAAAKLAEGASNLRNLLNVLDMGQIAGLSPSPPSRGLGPRAQCEHARPSAHKGLSAAVQVALADTGLARWELLWPSSTFVAVEPYETELPTLIEAAVAKRAETSGLRELLETANIDLDKQRS